MAGEAFERLIRELYECKGYLCLADIPGKPPVTEEGKRPGGRDQYDLVAIRFGDKGPKEVVWIEITEYLTSGAATLTAKFTEEKERFLRKYLKRMYNLHVGSGKITRRMYCKSDHPRIKKRVDLPAELVSNEEILKEIEAAIYEFQTRMSELIPGFVDPRNITLPSEFKHLKMVRWGRGKIV